MEDGSMMITLVGRISGNGLTGQVVVNTIRKAGQSRFNYAYTRWVIVGNPDFPNGEYDIEFADVRTRVRHEDGTWKFLEALES
jgi:hypothetical protein